MKLSVVVLVDVPGPTIVVQPAEAFVGSNSATYAVAAPSMRDKFGTTSEKLGAVGNATVVLDVSVRKAIGVIPVAPIPCGARPTLWTAGVPGGALTSNVADSVAAALAAGTMRIPV